MTIKLSSEETLREIALLEKKPEAHANEPGVLQGNSWKPIVNLSPNPKAKRLGNSWKT